MPHVSKKRYFIEISYDGTPYHGWQTQPNAITVQACLDKALSTFFRQDIISLGCGRTDAGVHATQFFAHFDVVDIVEEAVFNAISSLNSLLPYTIAIHQIFAVSDEAHARFDATARAYQYHIHFKKDPFKIDRSWLYKGKLDVEKMNAAAGLLFNFIDFSCFSKSKTQTFTNNCVISEAKFEYVNESLVFTVRADRFLRNMVRAIVGTMIMVGKGEIEIDGVAEIIASKNRSNAGQSVPACGLYLTKVEYPQLAFG